MYVIIVQVNYHYLHNCLFSCCFCFICDFFVKKKKKNKKKLRECENRMKSIIIVITIYDV